MVIADEWLLDRLRQMCEMKLCDLISLRNVCELLEFAQVCNADQLKKSCLQFACLNMPAIVESNSLNLLSESSLSALDRFYKQMVSVLSEAHCVGRVYFVNFFSILLSWLVPSGHTQHW